MRALLAALAWLAAGPAVACEGLCEADGRPYHLAVPEGEGPFPLVVFLHGAFATGEAMVNNGELRRLVEVHGFALAAPTSGTMQIRGRQLTNWEVRDGRPSSIEGGFAADDAFVRAVARNAASNHAISATYLSGFSRGSSLVWDMACHDPSGFDAFISVAGGFWHPMAQDCAAPVHLLHVHGWRDRTVPLEGRLLRGGALRQGDIFAGLDTWRRKNGCLNHRADAFETGEWWRRWWTECTSARALQLALHPGSHGIPKGFADLMADWVAKLPEPSSQ